MTVWSLLREAGHGEAIRAGIPSDADVDTMVFPPAVSLAALIVATTLSVYKPWGRIPRRSTAIHPPPAPTVPANRPTNQSEETQPCVT